jgi:hypothetical protein
MRTGAWEEALALETEIEAPLDRDAARDWTHDGTRDWTHDWPMTCANSLNQARLLKYLKYSDRSHACYERGFATTLGA